MNNPHVEVNKQTIKTKEIIVAEEEKEPVTSVTRERTEGAFAETLKRNSKAIRKDRADAIADELELKAKRSVEDIEVLIKHSKREMDNMLDMSPENSLSLIPAKNFNSDDFLKLRLDLKRKIRLLEIDLKLATEDYEYLFGKEQ